MGDREKAREALGESREDFPNLLEDLEVGIAVVGPKTEALLFNNAALELLGLTRDQLRRRPAFDPSWDVIHEDGTPFSAEEHPSAMAIQTKLPVLGVVAGVFRPLRGDRKWLLCNAVPHLAEDGCVIEVVCSFSDITPRKLAEKKLRESEEALHKLSGHLLQSQDDERRRISRELHDTASQILTALLTRLHVVAKSSPAMGHPAERAFSESLELAASAANFLRTFSSGLHPPILDEKGLAAAIRWYAEGISPSSAFRVEMESPPSLPRLGQQAERSLFRIAQEAIARIRLLTETAVVYVRLTSTPKEFALEIWGAGSDTPSAIAASLPATAAETNFGAAGMRERMRQLGGSLEISAGNSGTLIRAVSPLGQYANAVVASFSK